MITPSPDVLAIDQSLLQCVTALAAGGPTARVQRPTSEAPDVHGPRKEMHDHVAADEDPDSQGDVKQSLFQRKSPNLECAGRAQRRTALWISSRFLRAPTRRRRCTPKSLSAGRVYHSRRAFRLSLLRPCPLIILLPIAVRLDDVSQIMLSAIIAFTKWLAARAFTVSFIQLVLHFAA